jgi:large subunit ribosomal protein L24
MKTETKQPRKQRKARFTASSHYRRRYISSHLSDALIKEFNVRSLPVRKGDVVRVIRGNEEFKDKECTVTDIYTKDLKIGLEGVNVKKADGSEVARKIDPSNVIIVKLDLSDQKRRDKLDLLRSGGMA